MRRALNKKEMNMKTSFLAHSLILVASSSGVALAQNASGQAGRTVTNITAFPSSVSYEVPAPANLVGQCEEAGAPNGKIDRLSWGLNYQCTYTAIDGTALENAAKSEMDSLRRTFDHSITNAVDFPREDPLGGTTGFNVRLSHRMPTHRIVQDGRSAYGVNSVILGINISCRAESANCNEQAVLAQALRLGKRVGPFRGTVKENRSTPVRRDPGLSDSYTDASVEPLVFVRYLDGYNQPQTGFFRASDAARFGGGEATVIVTRDTYGNGPVTSVVPVSQAGGAGSPAFVVRQDTYANGPTDFVVRADSAANANLGAICTLVNGSARVCSR